MDKTGTITEGARRAIAFIPLETFTEQDVTEAAYAASFNDSTHEGRSIIEVLANEKKIEPSFMMEVLASRPIDFRSETRYSGIELSPKKKFFTQQESVSKTSAGQAKTRVFSRVEELEESNTQVRILKRGCRRCVENCTKGK